jgi:sugar lactone lactonase YvrE
MSIDWETELELPKRALQLEISERVFSPDGKKLALAEYHDLTDEPRYSPSPPPQVYVIDLETKKTQAFPISFTPYGLTFSRDGKSLLVGSHQTGELIRINLQAGKIDARVKARKGIQGCFLSPKGGYFLVSYSSRNGSVPLEVRRWKDLKVAGKIPLPPLLPELAEGAEFDRVKMTENGTRLVFALDGKRGGPRSDTRVIFDVKER